MSRPNWNGYRPDRHTTGAQRALLRSCPAPSETPAQPRAYTPLIFGQLSRPLPKWLPDCE